jgi:hypothetical protein
MATVPLRRDIKVNNLHETTELHDALMALPIVEAVSYEFPGYWDITMKDGAIYYLSDMNGPWAWNDHVADMYGDTPATEASDIAKDFAAWIELLEGADDD